MIRKELDRVADVETKPEILNVELSSLLLTSGKKRFVK